MPVTPNYSLPYPSPTDYVYQGPQNFEDLAEAVENVIAVLPTRVYDLITNGSMRVAQRTDFKSGINSSGYFVHDRWKLLYGLGGGTWSMEQSSAEIV